MSWINQQEIRIYGLRRTGQHAFIHWFLEHFEGKGLFLNNIVADPIDRDWQYTGFTPQEIQQDRAGHWLPKDWFMFSLEDRPFQMGEAIIDKRAHLCVRGSSGSVLSIIIVRDPLNLFASRIKASELRGETDYEWYDHPSYITYIEHLQIYQQFLLQPQEGVIAINYNQWVLDSNYRQELGEALGLVGDYHLPYEKVPDYGVGSSFDRSKYDGQASQMKVFERWREFQKDPRFVELIKRPPIAQWGIQIFSPFHPEYATWVQEVLEG